MRSIRDLGLWLSWVLPSSKRMGSAERLSGGSRSRNYIFISPYSPPFFVFSLHD
jgi:hypothetical protein